MGNGDMAKVLQIEIYIGNVSIGNFFKTLPIAVCQYMAKYSTYVRRAALVALRQTRPSAPEERSPRNRRP